MSELPAFSPIEFIDEPSTDNIPKDVKEVIDRVAQSFLRLHGDKLVSVYAHGSTVRGDFDQTVSDIDLAIITSEAGDSQELIDEEGQLLARLGADSEYRLDISTRDIQEFEAGSRPMNAAILAASGACVYGQEINFANFAPTDRLEFVEAVTTFYLREQDIVRSLDLKERESKSVRRIQKFTVRVLFALAVLEGAPFTTSRPKQLGLIQEYAPTYSISAEDTYRAIESGVQSFDDAFNVYSKACDSLRALLAQE